MKIVVQQKGEKSIKLVFPTGMIFNPVTAGIITPIINKTLAGDISKADEDIAKLKKIEESSKESIPENMGIRTTDMIRFCHEVNRMKRLHTGLPLIEVEDENGDGVIIYL